MTGLYPLYEAGARTQAPQCASHVGAVCGGCLANHAGGRGADDPGRVAAPEWLERSYDNG